MSHWANRRRTLLKRAAELLAAMHPRKVQHVQTAIHPYYSARNFTTHGKNGGCGDRFHLNQTKTTTPLSNQLWLTFFQFLETTCQRLKDVLGILLSGRDSTV